MFIHRNPSSFCGKNNQLETREFAVIGLLLCHLVYLAGHLLTLLKRMFQLFSPGHENLLAPETLGHNLHMCEHCCYRVVPDISNALEST